MIEIEERGHTAIITINRPEAKNAVNGDVAQGIEEGLDRLEESDELWVGVLTGAGDVFCAGADLKAINSGEAASISTERGGFGGIVLRDRAKPVIAAVDGPALAGGTEICLACDLIVASRAARFGVPEVKRSLVAAAGALFRLPAQIPEKLATELILTGDPFDAERAYELGLVNVLCDPGSALDEALALADRINANAPLAVRESLRLIRELDGTDPREDMNESMRAFAKLGATEDFSEGLTAFIEKRDPEWKAR